MAYTWQYYDLVLAGVFVCVALGATVGVLTALPVTTTVLASALVAVAIIGHGLFVNGPVDRPADLADDVDALN